MDAAAAQHPANIETHRAYLMAFARSRLRSDDEIEDLVQETLLAALRSRAAFRGESAFRTWLTSILLFKIADHRRQQGRATLISVDQLEEAQPGWLERAAPSAEEPVPMFTAQESRARVHAALRNLPAQQRDAWLLAEHHELPTATIQRILGVSADNVWVLLHRARKRLRQDILEERAAA
ncbi:MAG: sigma-70 family RNA polymerase sigma factor [Betaproteobacteria bacterium]|nr:sigma-70 family RNA polymerase sigma factor [Betaproteobacteria bacterium]